jgi:hypothetical protein
MPSKISNSLNFSVQIKNLPTGETIIKLFFAAKGQVYPTKAANRKEI